MGSSTSFCFNEASSMTERDMRKAAEKAKEMDWMEEAATRYGGPFPRKRNPKEASPKVEVEIVDVTEEVNELVKKGSRG